MIDVSNPKPKHETTDLSHARLPRSNRPSCTSDHILGRICDQLLKILTYIFRR